MIPGRESAASYFVFLILGIILGYGFWGADGGRIDAPEPPVRAESVGVKALQMQVKALTGELERQKGINNKLRTEQGRLTAELHKKKRAVSLADNVKKELSETHPLYHSAAREQERAEALLDKTGRFDPHDTVIMDYKSHPLRKQDMFPLIGTALLASRINDPHLKPVFVDSWPPGKNVFESEKIPGSAYMGISDLMLTIGEGGASPDREMFEKMMAKLGIGNHDYVVLYGEDGTNEFTLAAFWLMEYFGHGKVSYLNGGLAKWNMEERPVSTGFVKPEKSKYTSGKVKPHIMTTAPEVLKNMKNPETVIIDARGTDEYTGKLNIENNRRTGHIPGALDLDHYDTNFKEKDGTIKYVKDLKKIYEAEGVTKDKEIIVYCQAGIRTSNTYFILKHVLGYPNVKNYVGSWGEWGNSVDFNRFPVEVNSK